MPRRHSPRDIWRARRSSAHCTAGASTCALGRRSGRPHSCPSRPTKYASRRTTCSWTPRHADHRPERRRGFQLAAWERVRTELPDGVLRVLMVYELIEIDGTLQVAALDVP